MLSANHGHLKLNLGCGRDIRDGYVNIDAQENTEHPPDMISNVDDIALPDGCASEILAVHLWEHLYRWECDAVITEWIRLLEPEGLLVMEMPDLMKFCRNVLDGKADRIGLMGMYGDPVYRDPYMNHKWGWTFASIETFLAQHGFGQIVEETPKFHVGSEFTRDFRVVARKGIR